MASCSPPKMAIFNMLTHLRPTVTPGSSTQRSATIAPAASVTGAASVASPQRIVEHAEQRDGPALLVVRRSEMSDFGAA